MAAGGETLVTKSGRNPWVTRLLWFSLAMYTIAIIFRLVDICASGRHSLDLGGLLAFGSEILEWAVFTIVLSNV
ncbi:hypothetical protein F5Y01DRAFT_312966 [Xylaria sp. FL0043]|nr:hypothetical protein F5Y01DRAFT_312966 [Xylaria sp. FL0043]